MNITKIVLIGLIGIFVSSGFASAEQPPLSAIIVQSDPYYFSEGGLGLKLLKFLDVPLTPYLVPGKTTQNSTLPEISSAYNEYMKNSASKSIVNDTNRATVFSVEFSNGEINVPYKIDTFQKFTPIDKSTRNSPYYYQSVKYGLELESLPSKDKAQFYNEIVTPSINSQKKPEPIDVTVSIITGDGTTIQQWKYQRCTIIAYTPYLDENLVQLKFVGELTSEIRDKTALDCDGFSQDFAKTEPYKKAKTVLAPAIPEKSDRADRIIVQFYDGEIKSTNTFYSFSKFIPLAKDTDAEIPIAIPGNIVGEKPAFMLESLPSKDKEKYYEFIGRYINAGAAPQPFDATIHIISGDGKILQSWDYSACNANNYATFFTDNLILYKFRQGVSAEIREKTFFECQGLQVNSSPKQKIDTTQTFAANNSDVAQIFRVHFQGAEISPEKTVMSFTKFAPISNEELQFLVSGAPFGKEPKFYLESLPSKDNAWYYNLMSKYINAGQIPNPFDVIVDVLVGDGTQIQSWKYTDCQVLEYKTYLEDSLLIKKFTNKFEKEFRDRTIFQCVGLEFDSAPKQPKDIPQKTLDHVDFIPSEESRITRMITTLSDGELKEPIVINTIGKFTPKIEQRHQTQAHLVKLSVAIIPNETPSSGSATTYDKPETCGPGESPPGCTPCPPNNPHCSDDGDDEDDEDGEEGGGNGGDDEGGEDIPEPPEVPGITSPPFTVLVTMPHLSVIQKNDYVKSTEFTIKSLPSKDKLPYYDIVSKYINAGKKPEPIDVAFDYLSADNTIIQSWKYHGCEITDFKIKRDDVLLYFSLSGTPGVADIVDLSSFKCTGFTVDFDQKKSSTNSEYAVPSMYDRAMMNLAHWSGGELQNEMTTALIQEFNTLDSSDVAFGGLPNIHHKDMYQFVSRYVNPGKTPEPIDMRFDTVTGDGSVLYSTKYHDCTVKDSSTYLSDNMASIKYVPGLKSEIRGQAVSDCVGTSFTPSPQNNPNFEHGSLRKITTNTQRAIGVPSEEVTCKDGHELMIRPPSNVPVCVKDDHIEKFEARGWKQPTTKEKKNLVDVLRPILPTDNERAISFTVSFEGTDISPSKTSNGFSKFFPTENANAVIPRPRNSLDTSSKAFYLESLPNKDNSWYYELASRYTNAGDKPEPFNVTVEIKDGSGDALQTWKYGECEISDYTTHYDENLMTYKFHGKWQAEIKDKSLFSCAGLKIE
ncbi:MAG: hypothetical protein EB150_05180 [Nitrososphaeria archaeon]|nr:hypothetical protein [Nitrososphaeria archaeon]